MAENSLNFLLILLHILFCMQKQSLAPKYLLQLYTVVPLLRGHKKSAQWSLKVGGYIPCQFLITQQMKYHRVPQIVAPSILFAPT